MTFATGPYAPAILRFQISFPDSYPRLPPLVTFTTEMFHPLITPLTTYMYTTDIQDNGTVSATDAERLPPGGFSLRHGFPEWFGRGRRSTAAAKKVAATEQPSATPGLHRPPSAPSSESRSAGSSGAAEPSYMHTKQKSVSLYQVLKYVRSTFDSEDILDSITLDAAGNPNAWHAWRTHRKKLGKLPVEPAPSEGGENKDAEGAEAASEPKSTLAPAVTQQSQVRDPSEWNWDGVWELRVKKAIAASLSEPVLYGGVTSGAGDDVVSFASCFFDCVLALGFAAFIWYPCLCWLCPWLTVVPRFGSPQWMRKMLSPSSRTFGGRWKEVPEGRDPLTCWISP